jgi:hypothetical protein
MLGPFLWLLCFILIVQSLQPSTPRLHHTSVNNSIKISHLGESFVDDTSLGCTHSTPEDPIRTLGEGNASQELTITVRQLQQLAQEWERLLFSTGGALNLNKSFWFAMTWKWKAGKATLETISQWPENLYMTSGSEPAAVPVLRVDSTSTYRTLGVFLTPSGDTTGSYSIVKEQSELYATY